MTVETLTNYFDLREVEAMARNERRIAAKKFFEILKSADRETKASSSLQAVNAIN